MIDKVETIVPFFTGFYNSIFEDYWKYKDEIGKLFVDVINDDIKNVLPSFNYTFERIQSPKYYNYGTDEIYALATFDTDELLNYLIKNGDKFEEYCKNNFSSYDGFISFLPNNAYEFVEKMKTADASDKSSFVLGAISFVLENNYGEEYPDDLNYETYYDIADVYELDALDKEDTDTEINDHVNETLRLAGIPLTEDNNFDYMATDKKMQFQLLDRMKQDCEYFINGNRDVKHLWAGSIDEQIKAMRELQKLLNPEWLSSEDIDRYEEQMKDSTLTEDLDDDSEDELYDFFSTYFFNNSKLQSKFNPDILYDNRHEIFNKWKDLINNQGVDEWVAAEKAANIILKSKQKEKTDMNESTSDFDKLDESKENKRQVRYILDMKLSNNGYVNAEMYIAEPDPYGPDGWNIIPQEDYKMQYIDYEKNEIIDLVKEKAREVFENNEFETYVNGKKDFYYESIEESVDGKPSAYYLYHEKDDSWAVQRRLPDGSIERAGLYDSNEKAEALARVAELNGEKLNESVDSEINQDVLQELYDTITEAMGDDFLSDYDETDYDSIVDAVDDFGREIDGYDSSNLNTRLAYAHALKEKWKNEHKNMKNLDEDKYSKPSEDDVKPELKDEPEIQEVIKIMLDNWENYNDGEKSTLKRAIFNAGLGEEEMLREFYKNHK